VRSFALRWIVAAASLAMIFTNPRPVLAQSGSTQNALLVREKDAFYSDVRAKRYAAAVAEGALVVKRDPADDRFALDYAYALLADHQPASATALLERLKDSRIAAVSAAAQHQLAAQAPPPAAAQPILPPTASASPPPFTDAYELLAGGDLAASRDAFLATLATHPDDSAAWRQVSYIDFILKDRPGQIAALDKYIALVPDDDKARLERAYALLGQGETARGTAELNALTHSSDPDVVTAAKAQLAAGAGSGGGKPTRYDAFGYALNESRFHDTFYGLDAHYYVAPTRIQPYIAFHLTNDAKASSVPANEILNDNVAIVSAGLRTKISPIAYVFVEGGQAESLLTGHTESDLRYGALLSTRLGAGGFKSQTQIDASLTHYSRYVNTIAYADVTHNFYIGSKIVRGLVGVDLALDTSRAFYNNALDGLAGLQAHGGLFTYRVYADAGTYLPRGIGLPVQRTYTSINLEMLFGYSH
jgi:hypothetical protein